MNVLLLYPRFPATFWSFAHALWLTGHKALAPPVGLLTVAALLPPTWRKKLVDLNVAPLTQADLAWADCVFVSAMAVQRGSARALIARCKAAGKRVVCGGPLFADATALFDEVDHFVLNEAELTLPPFLAELERGCAGRFYRTDQFADLRATPVPLWELADLRRYISAGVQFSRGCPFDCEFCNVTSLLGRRPRTKSGAQITAELTALYDAGWRGGVFFVDDNLIGNRRALREELLPALAQWQKSHGPTSFITQVSLDLADDPELTAALSRVGFDVVFVGIETPDAASLAECHKRQNGGRDMVADVRRLQRAGLEVQGGFIVGFDHDGPSIFQRQADFIQKSGIVTAMVGMLQAPPGTRLHLRLLREGRLRGNSTGDNTDGTTNVEPHMGIEQLRQGYEALLRRLYAPRQYYRRIRAFLREYRVPPIRTAVTVGQVRTFLRTLLHLGILGRERLEYWRLLIWTLTRRPAHFATAVRLAICGRHFRKVMETIERLKAAPIS